MTELTRPPLTITLKGEDEDVEVKMTYGLFNEIMAVVPSPDDIGALLVSDNGLRDYVIRRMLTGNKKVTEESDLIDLFDVSLDITQLDELVSWVGDHILYFFTNSALKTQKLGEKYQETILRLSQSKIGAESSASKTPSAGPSDASKAT